MSKYEIYNNESKNEISRQKRAAYDTYWDWPKVGSNKNVVIPYIIKGIC